MLARDLLLDNRLQGISCLLVSPISRHIVINLTVFNLLAEQLLDIAHCGLENGFNKQELKGGQNKLAGGENGYTGIWT